jgi:hypothetical protein
LSVLAGLPQGERDDKREQALRGRRQPLDHAQVTTVFSCDQEPARQPGEGHRDGGTGAGTEDPRLRWSAPDDKHGPDRCRDDAADREGEVV